MPDAKGAKKGGVRVAMAAPNYEALRHAAAAAAAATATKAAKKKGGVRVAMATANAEALRRAMKPHRKKHSQRHRGRSSNSAWGAYPEPAPETAKAAAPKQLCAAEIAAGADPFTQRCWAEGLTANPRLQSLIAAVKSGEWLCDGGETLGAHQIIALEAAKMIAANDRVPHAPTDRRGMLVYHSTGSGKTTTAMGLMAAYWNSGKDIFFVTTNANSNGNPATEYAKLALVFYPEYVPIIFKNAAWMPPKPWSFAAYKTSKGERSFAAWCATVGGPIVSAKVQGPKGPGQLACSFWRFAGASADRGLERLKSDNGAVLIVDEAQNFFKPATEGNESKALEKLTKALRQEVYLKNSDVYLLTATPGDTAQQMMDMVNYVRPWGMPELTVRDFAANPKIARGLVSYADVRGDKTHYGTLATDRPINKYFPFHPRYYAAFLAEFGSTFERGEIRNLNANPDMSKKFFAKSVVAGCMMNATKVRPYFKDDAAGYEKLLRAKINNGAQEVVFSEKMRAGLEYCAKNGGCQYMYVPSVAVLKAVIDALQKSFGFERVDSSKMKKGVERTDKLRFYAFHPGIMDNKAQTPGEMKAVLDWFKSAANEHGQQIRLFVGTVYEGLDMSFLQTVHLMAPLPSVADDDQAVGRALRFCGHKKDRRSVQVLRYFSIAPRDLNAVKQGGKQQQQKIEDGMRNILEVNERGANAHVFADALRRGKPLNDFAMCVRGQSIECEADPGNGGILGGFQYGAKTRCGVPRCEVKLNAKGELIVPPPRGPGKHGPLPHTIHNVVRKPTDALKRLFSAKTPEAVRRPEVRRPETVRRPNTPGSNTKHRSHPSQTSRTNEQHHGHHHKHPRNGQHHGQHHKHPRNGHRSSSSKTTTSVRGVVTGDKSPFSWLRAIFGSRRSPPPPRRGQLSVSV